MEWAGCSVLILWLASSGESTGAVEQIQPSMAVPVVGKWWNAQTQGRL